MILIYTMGTKKQHEQTPQFDSKAPSFETFAHRSFHERFLHAIAVNIVKKSRCEGTVHNIIRIPRAHGTHPFHYLSPFRRYDLYAKVAREIGAAASENTYASESMEVFENAVCLLVNVSRFQIVKRNTGYATVYGIQYSFVLSAIRFGFL